MIRRAITRALAPLAAALRCYGLRADIAGWEDDLARLEARRERNPQHEDAVQRELVAARAELLKLTTPATARGI